MNITDIEKYYTDCTLCPRNCHADRLSGGRGFCGMGAEVTAAKAYNHMWEEPCLTGKYGSGTVFFSGCNLKCIFCQNHEISSEGKGTPITVEKLAYIFLKLQENKASNINLVTGVCFIPHIIKAVSIARTKGLTIPVVYNSSGYESPDSIRLLEGTVDIYMPDLKYVSPDLSAEFSKAPDYPDVAKNAIAEMFLQTGTAVFSEDGMMKRGVLVRHLVLPGHVGESKKILRYLHDTYGNDVFVSIMSQYTPTKAVASHPDLGRKVSPDEYKRVLDFADSIGIEKGFTQEGEAAEESFIPHWDLDGIL